jgi:hypothetical protein
LAANPLPVALWQCNVRNYRGQLQILGFAT